MILVMYLLDGYFRSRAASYVLIQLNAATAVQMLFIERLFVFFITLFLRTWGSKFKQTPMLSQTPQT